MDRDIPPLIIYGSRVDVTYALMEAFACAMTLIVLTASVQRATDTPVYKINNKLLCISMYRVSIPGQHSITIQYQTPSIDENRSMPTYQFGHVTSAFFACFQAKQIFPLFRTCIESDNVQEKVKGIAC